MSFNIMLNGRKWGEVELTEDGGTVNFDAEGPFRPGIYRLYMLSDDAVLPLGVMMPEDGKLKLHRRARRSMLPSGAFTRAVLCEGDETPEREEGFSPFDERWLPAEKPEKLTRDEVLSAALEKCRGVLYSYGGGRTEIAVPAGEHEHISCALCFARPEKVNGRDVYVLHLDGRGFPEKIL